ncbi:serine/arginine-rich splicing factor 12-like [Apostichopus japonicus]|uniref:serine/arginine-rich splicing factor 12-like n=1 Tax=Stichopus japonicus TaxID=307972 RepID=UPI003AB26472
MSRYHRPPNTSLFVRNIAEDVRVEDVRRIFGKYGPISDVYIPLDHHTHMPRGFAYVQFEDGRDAEDALMYLRNVRLSGRDLEIQYAEGDRKTPGQMRSKERYGRTPPGQRDGSPRRRRRSRSRSRDRRRRSRSHSRSRSRDRDRRRRRNRSRSNESRSPEYRRRSRSRSRTRSRSRERS